MQTESHSLSSNLYSIVFVALTGSIATNNNMDDVLHSNWAYTKCFHARIESTYFPCIQK